MKTSEILFASAVIALVAGAGAAWALRALDSSSARAEAVRADAGPRASHETALSTGPSEETRRALDELRLENGALRTRLAEVEARLAELANARTPLVTASTSDAEGRAGVERIAAGALADDEFIASVRQVLDALESEEDADREQRRKELQAERIEARVAELQQELGLTQRQASDLRTAFLASDDKRDALFEEMRDGEGDPRALRDEFRTLRDELDTTLQGIFTPEQYTTFREREGAEFGRFGDFGPPGGPERATGGRERRERRAGG
jgi:chromosome segregation ATPase